MASSRADAEHLYRAHAPAVFRRARSLLGDEQEALDVMQETFMAYLKSSGQLRGEAQPFTVLYQIATYQSLERLRRKARWSNVLGPTLNAENGDAFEGEADAPAPGSPFAPVDAAQDLALLTRGEDAQTMTAAVLYFVEGCTTEEVAQVLELSRKTVGKLLAQFTERARKRAERFSPGAFP